MDIPETRYARSGDVSIAYQVTGDGPFDIVFVPPFVSHVELAWQVPVLKAMFDRLASFSRLIHFDKRGTGMSDRVTGVPTLETRMDDLRAIMDAVGSERAAVLGWSEGCPMSALFAATYPERVWALVLYGGRARTLRAPDYPWGSTEAEALRAIADGRALGEEPGAAEALARSGSPEATEEEIRALATFVRYSASPGAVEAIQRMNMLIDVRDALPAIRTPTLVVHHVDDPWCQVERGRDMAERIPGATYVELPGMGHIPAAADVGPVLDETERFLREAWQGGSWEGEPERVLATVLFTDIVDSTAKAVELGDARWRELVQAHHGLVRRQLVRHRGTEIDTAGDGFFASFDGPARAIRCACAISEGVRELGIEIRAGLHTGECERIDNKVGGIAVNIGARVASEAGAGEVLVSSTVKDLVAGSGIAFSERGVTELKGVPGEWRLFAVEQA
ncbi:MAG TPA: adenylate/guanylate cyclase domain-containing protein [Gaiellaceae bacterium]|nr:adenylate/guanylate cyclase domain-containing protein [Gaiellaceae bacterium]